MFMGEFHPDFDGVWVCMGLSLYSHLHWSWHALHHRLLLCRPVHSIRGSIIPISNPSAPFPWYLLMIMVALSEAGAVDQRKDWSHWSYVSSTHHQHPSKPKTNILPSSTLPGESNFAKGSWSPCLTSTWSVIIDQKKLIDKKVASLEGLKPWRYTSLKLHITNSLPKVGPISIFQQIH